MESKINTLSWKGYLRKDGSKGIRNKVLVIYTVECSSHVAKSIASAFPNEDVDVIGFTGCYDNEYVVRMLLALARHPNIGAVLAVGLGCEYTQPSKIADIAAESGRLADWLFIQDCGGTSKTIEKGKKILSEFIKRLKEETKIVDMSFEDLTIGCECGGSDFTSGLAGNVVVGRLFDRLVDMGGKAIFEEIVEAIGLKKILLERAANEKAYIEIEATYDKALEYCKAVRQYSVSPGNFAGGLTTIEEKSMGAVIKSGSRPIEGVIKVSQNPPNKGLWLLDSVPDPHWMNFGYTNPNDSEGLMDLISCGSQLVFLVTGRGNVIGSAVSPTIKITGNSETFKNLEDDMDFNAGKVLNGECTLEELTDNLLRLIAKTCSGELSKGEKLGHKEYYISYKYQDENRKRPCRR
ncbi:UxaA family hydrolase [Maledivibacter halophilus]|uniref:Altronate hydrolase n=1 Tax=Maledivibacter halophilus TaxID=36842 RepID=A0A1T5M8G8_9FIRM|nr:UxaA family hydrolase [Maledivibacter halophilus]SKC84393.1 altronate hydrolase [Maledivibacter halophilus]